jgi:hypothetical protein
LLEAEIGLWEEPAKYDLEREHHDDEDGALEQLIDEHILENISYVDAIPGVVFHLQAHNVDGDIIRLNKSPIGDHELETEVGDVQPSEPGDIEETLNAIGEMVHDIQLRLAPLEDAAKNTSDLKDLVQQILDKVDDDTDELESMKNRIGVAEDKLDLINTVEIPRINVSIQKLEGSRPADSSVLQALEDQLKLSKADISASQAQGEVLVAAVFEHWQTNLTAFEDAAENPDIQPVVKEKIQELRSYIARKISETSALRGRIANSPVFTARAARLQANAISNMNEVLGTIGYLKRSIG